MKPFPAAAWPHPHRGSDRRQPQQWAQRDPHHQGDTPPPEALLGGENSERNTPKLAREAIAGLLDDAIEDAGVSCEQKEP